PIRREFEVQKNTKNNLHVRILLCRPVSGNVHDYFVIAPRQIRKTKATATVSHDLIDQATAKSLESHGNIYGGLSRFRKTHFAANFESQGVAGVSITLALAQCRRDQQKQGG